MFALMSRLPRRRVSLGVRQDTVALTRHRHPDKPIVQLAALMLERLSACSPDPSPWWWSARIWPDATGTHAVVHVALISLLRERDILAREPIERDYAAPELRMLSVGRLDPEKNPLLLADVFASALACDPRWRLHVCGSGPLASPLARRLEQLGVADRVVLHGYVPIDDGLWELYRSSHAFLHVSLTEGFPQVLLEAFAARLPVVATAVGGVPEIVRECGLLVPPQDARARQQRRWDELSATRSCAHVSWSARSSAPTSTRSSPSPHGWPRFWPATGPRRARPPSERPAYPRGGWVDDASVLEHLLAHIAESSRTVLSRLPCSR